MRREATKSQGVFFTPERFAQEQTQSLESARGRLLVASCRSGAYLAARVVNRYQELLTQAGSDMDVLYLENLDHQFSDTETCVRLDADVSGYDVFLFQALYDPTSDGGVDQNYMAFLIAVRALRDMFPTHMLAFYGV